ncbi:hypothetical protein GLYMA_09G231600v4 [Glycine max]|nr:hypothetical protein GLYMA_09G231600v4 [Glycine max]KAH1044407.1 hypothetical protein GYH30_025931 [Glycine max]|eukprot:XP_014617278.1 agamous-like MADS-box protein AGL12 isoform X2 [Glycine max]
MARGKVQLKRIENPVHRQVTFCKRRAGLLKKAKELSVLCDAEIGLFIFSAHGKLYELATKGTMQGLIERYMKFTRGAQPEAAAPEAHPLLEMPLQDAHKTINGELKVAKEETNALKQEIQTLQKGISYLFEGGNKTMAIDELQLLEKNLETWIYHIRSMKEGTLKAANKYLHDKIVENTAISNFAEFATDTSYPLIVQDGGFQLY